MMPPHAAQTDRFRLPTVSASRGSAYFHPSGNQGWDHPPLYLPRPVLIMRVGRDGVRVETPEGVVIARAADAAFTPFQWIEEILAVLAESVSGSQRRLLLRPAFPLAAVAASYEFGSVFHPHEGCFPQVDQLEQDLLTVAFHASGFVRHEGRWKRIGSPPVRGARWRDWSAGPLDTDWPPPPEITADTTSRARRRSPLDDAFSASPAPAMTREQYGAAFREIQRRLGAGDIYQANLTVRFEGETGAPPESIFGEGIALGGERYAAMYNAGACTHLSFSPELFLRRRGRSVETKPIKGTRPRGDAATTDTQQEAGLLSSDKDRAEHLMIVDLERNDFGRICEYGSVRVDPLMAASHHPTVIHMESTVMGSLRPTIKIRDVFSALFPGGSVTGAPKKRALEIIGAVENRPRGLYCGALGWIDARGDIELNLPIRTATMHHDGRIFLHAGGGIVADSTEDGEWAELHNKLAFLQKALAVATRAPIA